MKFKKLIMGVLATLGLATGMASAQDADMSRKAIAERLKPIGTLCLQGNECGAASAPSADGGSQGASGEEIYGQVCTACHDTGAAGAPKRGDQGAWASRLEQGVETLYTHAIDGFGAMPAKGGNPSLSDDDVKRAVNHLVEPVFDGELPQIGGGGGEAAAAGGDAQAGSDIDGEAIYGSVCMACHDTGVAGAPKIGDAAAWSPRLEKGTETLYSHAINGFNAMPPKGGNPSLSDAEVKAAVDHLIESVE